MKRLWSGTLIQGALAGAMALSIALPASFAQAPADQGAGMPDTQPAATLLSPDQLDNLVAPIALYPDQLLSQVLVASTYPLEVVEAQQWLQQNGGLHGQALMDAARQQNWDPSIQALVAFPQALATMNQDVQWTTALGNAFLAQQSDVMAAVQRMRARAQANGRLASTPQQTVTTEAQGGQSAIEIVPADPQVIYVPEYNPAYIWGPPVWGFYPPLAYYGYGFGFFPGINIGLCFGGWGGWGWGGWGWGWGPNWFGGGVFVNGGFFNRYGFRAGYLGGYGGGFGRVAWQHDPMHRLGVSYPNRQLAGRYGAASMASRSAMSRSNFNSYRGAGAGTFNRGAGMQGGNGGVRGQSYGGGASRGYNGNASRSFGGANSFNGGARGQSFNSGVSRGYNGNASRSFGGANSFNSGARGQSFNSGASRSSGNTARSFGGGSNSGGSRSFGGSSGGGARSFGGGGHSFGGGHSGGGRR